MFYLVELESDFSRFHGVSDIYEMHSVQFLNLAFYLSSYESGAMRLRIDQASAKSSSPSPTRRSSTSTKSSDQVKTLEPGAFMAVQSEYFDFVKAG